MAQYFKDSQNPRSSTLRWGFIDKSGKFITAPRYQFDQVQPFSGGFAGVAVYQQDPNFRRVKNLKWGFINRMGKLITSFRRGQGPFPFDGVRPFSEGFAAVMTRVHDTPASPSVVHEQWCFVNSQGALINPLACFGEVQDFHDGRAKVTTGYVDENGHFSLEDPGPSDSSASTRENSIAPSKLDGVDDIAGNWNFDIDYRVTSATGKASDLSPEQRTAHVSRIFSIKRVSASDFSVDRFLNDQNLPCIFTLTAPNTSTTKQCDYEYHYRITNGFTKESVAGTIRLVNGELRGHVYVTRHAENTPDDYAETVTECTFTGRRAP